MTVVGGVAVETQAEQQLQLLPYVPRLVVDWMRTDPGALYRGVEGSLAFVDISGFTALTERLARKGKIGAELMRDTLDGVFTALLDEAYDWGAGLLKWGGDALLLLFDGEGHPQRAARAAWEMQRTIQRVGRLRVAGGTVTLRMSIGIATGEIDFFSAGSVHRELLVAGPTATETVTIEGIADADEIGISHALARHLDPRCVGLPKEEALLLAAPPDVERVRAPGIGDIDGLDIASCIPVAARAHVLLERSEPEHRTITAAFIDLMNTDELLAELGPDVFAAELDQRISSIQEAALAYDVPFYETDIGKGSVKALLTAGAPSSTGHDEERMLRALREVMDTPGIVPIRIGVNTGKVFTGDFGPPYRRAYRVFGDAINTAARVMSRAMAGQILSTETVLDRSRTIFETTPIEPFQAKGKAELVRAWVVGPVAGTRDERTVETPLVGRDRELAALLAAVDEMHAGSGGVVEVSGAAGLGRSRLVHELAERVPEATVLHARCEEYEASTPYFALRTPMRTALGLGLEAGPGEVTRSLRGTVARHDPSLVPWLPLLGILLGLELPPTPETAGIDERFLRDILADVASRFFASTLGTAPLLFVVEDAQFIDEASSGLLHRVARAAASPCVLLVTHSDPARTWTATGDDAPPHLAVTLLPLAERHLREIVEVATDERPLLPQDVEEISRRSGGNVLFLFELLDLVRSTGSTDALPESVEALVAGEIDHLAPTDRAVLRYASVLGVTFDPLLLTVALRDAVMLDESLWDRLSGLVDRNADGGMRFRNTLVRDAAYEGLPFRRRRELHRRVAEAIESAAATPEEEASTLALHFFEARRHDKAWHYCRLAGDRARAVAANVEAGRFYERALEAGRHVRDVGDRERAAVWVALGAVREAAGLFDPSFGALRRATRLLTDDPVEQARVFALRTRARVRTGAYSNALRETTVGLRLVDAVDTLAAIRARAMLRAMRSEIRYLQGHPREAIALAEVAAEEAERSEELEALTHAYTALDGSYQLLGEPHKAVHERMSLEIFTRLGHTRLRGIAELNLGVQAYADGRWDEAVDLYVRAQEDCLQAGDRSNAAIAATNLGEVLISRGALDEAERLLLQARRALRSSSYTPFALFAEGLLARLALVRGHDDAALDSLTAIMEEARAIGHAGIALEISVYFAEAATAAGVPAQGLAVLEDAADRAAEDAALHAVSIDRVRGAALAALGRLDEARDRLGAALKGARQQALLYEQVRILRERCELARRSGETPDPEELRDIVQLAQLLGLDPRAV
jgi:class 3 adenylate cyclase/tetratricopeptide (TPR) repeat protein